MVLHASGIIISTAWASDRPLRCQQLEALIEAHGVGRRPGRDDRKLPLEVRDESVQICASRASIQLRLPWTVLISPCAPDSGTGGQRARSGMCFVEKRCARARAADSIAGRAVGEDIRSCGVVSMPL